MPFRFHVLTATAPVHWAQETKTDKKQVLAMLKVLVKSTPDSPEDDDRPWGGDWA